MAKAKKGWWARNWKWFVPVGCLGMLVLSVGLVAAMALIGHKMLTSSFPYRTAVTAAKADPRVIEALGSPIKDGWVFGGKVTENRKWSLNGPKSDTGRVSLAITLYGPKGKGTLEVYGDKSAGKWTFSTLSVSIYGQEKTIDLNEKPAPAPPTGAKGK